MAQVGDEHDTTGNDRNNRDTTVFDNPQGTPNESWIVWQIWNAMDTNCVGYVEAFDFIKWFSSRGKLSLAPKLWKSVSGKEDRITLLNILRSLWPRAQSDDFDAMRLVIIGVYLTQGGIGVLVAYPNIGRSVLGFIEAAFCKQILFFQHC